MVVVSYSGKEINAKLVYYGAGLSGKTSNLESIYEAVPDTSRGKMVSMKTQSDRTLFFDLLPLDLGEIMGFKTRFLLYTVPGQVFYNATRKLVLKGADAIVFVADSETGKMDENKESLANLRANLAEYGLKLEEIPWVIQYNKRDLPEVYTIQELNAELNPDGKVPNFEAVATQGVGVFETFRGISHLLMEKVTKELRRAPLSGARGQKVEDPPFARPAPAPTPAPIAAVPPAPPPPAAAPEPEPAPLFAPVAENEVPFPYGRQLKLETPATGMGIETHAPLDAPVAPAAVSSPSPDRSAATLGFESRPPAHTVLEDGPDTLSLERISSAPERPSMSAPPARQKAPIETEALAGEARPNEVVVVPLTLTRGASREIVIRIVISEAE